MPGSTVTRPETRSAAESGHAEPGHSRHRHKTTQARKGGRDVGRGSELRDLVSRILGPNDLQVEMSASKSLFKRDDVVPLQVGTFLGAVEPGGRQKGARAARAGSAPQAESAPFVVRMLTMIVPQLQASLAPHLEQLQQVRGQGGEGGGVELGKPDLDAIDCLHAAIQALTEVDVRDAAHLKDNVQRFLDVMEKTRCASVHPEVKTAFNKVLFAVWNSRVIGVMRADGGAGEASGSSAAVLRSQSSSRRKSVACSQPTPNDTANDIAGQLAVASSPESADGLAICLSGAASPRLSADAAAARLRKSRSTVMAFEHSYTAAQEALIDADNAAASRRHRRKMSSAASPLYDWLNVTRPQCTEGITLKAHVPKPLLAQSDGQELQYQAPVFGKTESELTATESIHSVEQPVAGRSVRPGSPFLKEAKSRLSSLFRSLVRVRKTPHAAAGPSKGQSGLHVQRRSASFNDVPAETEPSLAFSPLRPMTAELPPGPFSPSQSREPSLSEASWARSHQSESPEPPRANPLSPAMALAVGRNLRTHAFATIGEVSSSELSSKEDSVCGPSARVIQTISQADLAQIRSQPLLRPHDADSYDASGQAGRVRSDDGGKWESSILKPEPIGSFLLMHEPASPSKAQQRPPHDAGADPHRPAAKLPCSICRLDWPASMYADHTNLCVCVSPVMADASLSVDSRLYIVVQQMVDFGTQLWDQGIYDDDFMQLLHDTMDVAHVVVTLQPDRSTNPQKRCVETIETFERVHGKILSGGDPDPNAAPLADVLLLTFIPHIRALLQQKLQQLGRMMAQINAETSVHTHSHNRLSNFGATERASVGETEGASLPTGLHVEDFEVLKAVSRGAYGRLYLARLKQTEELFAIKVLRKSDLIHKNAVNTVKNERNILAMARNPFVVRFYYSFDTSTHLFVVMEWCPGGDLYSMLLNLGCLDEKVARVYVAETVLALEYCHSLGIIHRDVKPDNLLVAADGHIKLADFGLSVIGAAMQDNIADAYDVHDSDSALPRQRQFVRPHRRSQLVTDAPSPSPLRHALSYEQFEGSDVERPPSQEARAAWHALMPATSFHQRDQPGGSLGASARLFGQSRTPQYRASIGEALPVQTRALRHSSMRASFEANSVPVFDSQMLLQSPVHPMRLHEPSLHRRSLNVHASDSSRRSEPQAVVAPLLRHSSLRPSSLVKISSSYSLPSNCMHGELLPRQLRSSTVQEGAAAPSPLGRVLEPASDLLSMVPTYSARVSARSPFMSFSGGAPPLSSPQLPTVSSDSPRHTVSSRVQRWVETCERGAVQSSSPLRHSVRAHSELSTTVTNHSSPERPSADVSRALDADRRMSSLQHSDAAMSVPSEAAAPAMAFGTPDYLAPEQLAGAEHTCCVDWWSLGCVLFEFCYGAPPFHAETPEEIFSNVLDLNIQWPQFDDESEDVSPECKDLIRRLLHPDPAQRLGAGSAHEIKLHPWFKDIDWDSLILQKACFIPTFTSDEDTTYFQPRKPTSLQSMAKDFSTGSGGTLRDVSMSEAGSSGLISQGASAPQPHHPTPRPSITLARSPLGVTSTTLAVDDRLDPSSPNRLPTIKLNSYNSKGSMMQLMASARSPSRTASGISDGAMERGAERTAARTDSVPEELGFAHALPATDSATASGITSVGPFLEDASYSEDCGPSGAQLAQEGDNVFSDFAYQNHVALRDLNSSRLAAHLRESDVAGRLSVAGAALPASDATASSASARGPPQRPRFAIRSTDDGLHIPYVDPFRSSLQRGESLVEEMRAAASVGALPLVRYSFSQGGPPVVDASHRPTSSFELPSRGSADSIAPLAATRRSPFAPRSFVAHGSARPPPLPPPPPPPRPPAHSGGTHSSSSSRRTRWRSSECSAYQDGPTGPLARSRSTSSLAP